MLPAADPNETFERLRALPFVELGNDGLVVHDTVREVVAAYLRASDPDRSRRYRTAAWRQLQAEIATAGRAGVGRYTADLLYLLENPVIREAFFPRSGPAYTVGDAEAGDLGGHPPDLAGLVPWCADRGSRGLVEPCPADVPRRP